MGHYYPFFKAYDVRGRVPDELNADVAYRIGRALATILRAGQVIVGRDMRRSSAEIAQALSNGLTDAGLDVADIGLCGTEEVYHATFSTHASGGVMVTASHNPGDYNGMKFVREDSRPISSDTGLLDIEEKAATGKFISPHKGKGRQTTLDIRAAYVQYLLTQVDVSTLKPLKVVVDAGNGCAGLVIDALESFLPFEFIKLHHEPDGSFPNGVPNPLLPENREATRKAVLEHKADLGVAWDGDFDRCFLYDERGEFIEGYYIVGLIAETILASHRGGRIIYDPRLVWNTVELVCAAGGTPIVSKAGHSYIKERMRAEGALYGGEMSAHHYFKEFAYCDNGTLPWLFVAQLMGLSGKPLSSLVDERIKRYPASGEINFSLQDAKSVIDRIEGRYANAAISTSKLDGLSMEFTDWRFNLRPSNTEPVVRLNVETRANQGLLQDKVKELSEMLAG